MRSKIVLINTGLGLWVRKFPSENFRKFILIFPEISGNLLNNFFHFIIFNYHHRKKIKISIFLSNNSPDLCFLTLCIKIRQNNLYLASLPRISANLDKNYRPYYFQASANISGNFRKISGNIKFPENLQPYTGLSKMSFMITIPTLLEPEVYQFVLKVMLFEMRD